MKCASIPSHFSRSDLLLSPVAVSDIMCGDWRSARNSTFSRHTLTMKVLKAATELSSLAAITSPVENRTPFLVRMFSLSCVVQRAAFFEKGIMFDSTRDCIGLVRGIEIDGSDVGHFTIYVASNKSSFTWNTRSWDLSLPRYIRLHFATQSGSWILGGWGHHLKFKLCSADEKGWIGKVDINYIRQKFIGFVETGPQFRETHTLSIH